MCATDRRLAARYDMAILIGLVLGALIGWLIGKNKGLGGLGIVLGGLLGVIGWIIVAVMKGTPPTPPNQL
jgi:hypothetical protein